MLLFFDTVNCASSIRIYQFIISEPVCTGGQELTECGVPESCIERCDTINDPPRPCQAVCEPNVCRCTHGKVLHDGQCIEKELCPKGQNQTNI